MKHMPTGQRARTEGSTTTTSELKDLCIDVLGKLLNFAARDKVGLAVDSQSTLRRAPAWM
jgi:hypothetical protein